MFRTHSSPLRFLSVLALLALSPLAVLASGDAANPAAPSEPAAETEAPPAPSYVPPQELTPDQLQNYEFKTDDKNVEMDVSDLSLGDRFIMQKQRTGIGELMARKLGILRFNENLGDLDLLQRIVDEKLIATDDVEQWQALGVVLGDLLARELDLHWVQVEDDLGVSRALQLAKSKSFVFPVTMFSKRAQFGEKIKVREIYDKVAKDVEHFRHLDRLNGLNPPQDAES